MKHQIIINWDDQNRMSGIDIRSSLMRTSSPLPLPMLDFGVMCESLVQMIHAMENSGIQNSATTLRQAIAHLENGFVDTRFERMRVIEPEDDGERTYNTF